MTKQEIFDKLLDIVHEAMPQTKNETITSDTIINRDVGVDSMNFILVICRTELAFDIEIPDDKWTGLSTMGDIVDMIDDQMKQQKKG